MRSYGPERENGSEPEPRSDSLTAESDSIPTVFRQSDSLTVPTVSDSVSDSSPSEEACMRRLTVRQHVRQSDSLTDDSA